jgi:hypothetical protein
MEIVNGRRAAIDHELLVYTKTTKHGRNEPSGYVAWAIDVTWANPYPLKAVLITQSLRYGLETSLGMSV